LFAKAVREMYGANPASTHFLRARRLVEAGVGCVTLASSWPPGNLNGISGALSVV